jgi:hypothetical protein
LRTVTEEFDSLTFNNARLSKRVAVLQEALEDEKSKATTSSSWFGSGAKAELSRVQQQLQVLREELEVKIRENEELHIRIFETGQETGTIKEDLQERITLLKAEIKTKTEQLEDLTQSNKHTVSRLSSENSTLQTRTEELSDTLVRTKSLMQQREHTMTQVQQQLTAELESASTIISTKLPFNDSVNHGFNQLNLPTHDHSNVSKRNSISVSAITLFKKFIGFWKEWCDAEHEKMLFVNQSTNGDVQDAHRQINRKLGAHLAEFSVVLTSLISSYASFMATESLSIDGESSKREVQQHLQAFVSLHERTSLTMKSRLESESAHFKMFLNNESARSYNNALIDNWMQSQSQLESFSSYFSIFCGATGLIHDSSSPAISNALFSLRRAYDSIINLRNQLKERVGLMQQIFSLETAFDAFMPNDIKLLNNRRINALSNACAMFEKICELIHEYLESLASVSSQSMVRSALVSFPDGLVPLEPMASKSRRFLQSLNASHQFQKSISIPYSEQLKHVEQISELASILKSKEIDIIAMRQQLVQRASIADKTAQELRLTKETLLTRQTSLQEALTEVAELKNQLALHLANVAQFGSSPPSTIQGSDTHSPRSTLQSTTTEATINLTKIGALESDPIVMTSNPPPPSYNLTTNSSSDIIEPPTYANFLATHVEPTTETTLLHSNHSNASLGFDMTSIPATFQTGDDLLAEFRTVTPSMVETDAAEIISATSSTTTTASTSSTSHILTSMVSPGSFGTNKQPWNMIVVGDDSSMGSSTSLELGDPDKDREELMKRYYEQRVQQFQSKVDATDKKNVELYQQTMDLERRIKDAITQREGLKSELDAASKRYQAGNDELETTRANYDQQLKMLTEHMVGLSDKIGTYEDQLSILKNSTVRCGKCKAWNTIEWLMGEGKMGQRCSHGNHPSSFNYA